MPTGEAPKYIVRATSPATGAGFRGEYLERGAALKAARQLRDSGMLATIIGPDGRPVNDTEQKS